MRLEYRDRPFELKASAGADGAICTFEGLGACCVNLDDNGDIIDTGAFDQELAWTKANAKVRDEHCRTTGKLVDVKAQPDLWVKGEVYDTTPGRDQAVLLKTGSINRLSIGYMVLAREWLDTPDAVQSYWKGKGYTPTADDLLALGYFGGARLLKTLRVAEVSTTWMPANGSARITSVKGRALPGRTLDAHAAAVLVTVGEFLDRAESAAKLRGEKGRSLSAEVQTKAKTLIDRLAALGQTAAPAANHEAALAAYAAAVADEARSLGVTVD